MGSEMCIRDSSTTCFNTCNGASTVTVTGGTSSYYYQWDDPLLQNTSSATNLCAGLYNVVVTDDNGCTISNQTTVNEPNQILLDSTVINANCGLANGQGCVTATGGSGSFNYLWPDNSTNSCNTGLIAGSYLVEVTDLNNLYIQDGKCKNVTIDGWWIDAGTPDRIIELEGKLT